MAVAVAVVAWTILEDESPKTSASTSVEQLPAAVPAGNSETTNSDPKYSAEIVAPRMTINETEFDFGFVPQNARVSHIFWLYSTGTDTLKILQVNPG